MKHHGGNIIVWDPFANSGLRLLTTTEKTMDYGLYYTLYRVMLIIVHELNVVIKDNNAKHVGKTVIE